MLNTGVFASSNGVQVEVSLILLYLIVLFIRNEGYNNRLI